MNYFPKIAILLSLLCSSISQSATVSSGTLTTLTSFKSELVTQRDIHIWLPNGYNENHAYDVLYMHDGQMLFDANTTWNKQEWGVDEIASKLIAEKKVRPFIVVGIDNDVQTRHSDYFPQAAFNLLTKQQQQTTYLAKRDADTLMLKKPINSDNYLKFLVTELKPYIDSTYSVNTSVESTFILGSSMGGLISMYAISEYPDVFGGAACLSTHWPGVAPHDGNPIPDAFAKYMSDNLPAPDNHKIYFDYGDKTLDAFYPPLQQKIDKVMKVKGYDESQWQTFFFKGHNHSENAWRSRLDKPLLFLLGKN
ncbi:alpha/beta hydrolase [Thalassotalea atypica]|uniref:alpha/beta hydrolase n=1 Tax=Thalassotalea atypica TaxID=2054316 RepID=UPI0025732E92|nr:alpha/beta fold hydrolase [Thalassotalea atypica]